MMWCNVNVGIVSLLSFILCWSPFSQRLKSDFEIGFCCYDIDDIIDVWKMLLPQKSWSNATKKGEKERIKHF